MNTVLLGNDVCTNLHSMQLSQQPQLILSLSLSDHYLIKPIFKSLLHRISGGKKR